MSSPSPFSCDATTESFVSGVEALVQVVRDADSLKHVPCDLYTHLSSEAEPLIAASVLCVTVIALCWLLSVIMHNYSQVDRVWSIVPFLYAWVYFHAVVREVGGSVMDAAAQYPRLFAMAILPTIWGVRLSYNFYRKGGYNLNDEDYRWPILREKMSPFLFQVFNVFFIAIAQNVLLFLIVLPIQVAYVTRNEVQDLQTLDVIAIVVYLALVVIETTADQQQWNFQTEKYARINKGTTLTGVYAPGFIYTGLFKYSRHPNFVCEQSIWWTYSLFALSSACKYASLSTSVDDSWTDAIWVACTGAVLLTLLFQGSTNMTEELTAGKYCLYEEYQSVTPRLVPWFPSGEFPPPSGATGRVTRSRSRRKSSGKSD